MSKLISAIKITIHIFLFIAFMGCNIDGTTNTNSSDKFLPADTGNYTEMEWLDAYDAFHAQISQQYAFSDWKNIDWVTLNNEIRPKIALAEQNNDEVQYATALLEYTRSLPDGHVSLNGGRIFELIFENIAGSYGLGITGLDDGRIIANIVLEGGAAAEAGLEVGDEILEWNGVDIKDALDQVSTLWWPSPASLATEEHTLLEKYRMLVLDTVNSQSEVTFCKDGEVMNSTAVLTAVDDNNQILESTELWNKVDADDPIQYEILDSGYGYILLGALESEEITYDELSKKFKEAMEYLTFMDVPGLIIDLRGNGGGYDNLAAEVAGYFYSQTTIYEYQSCYNKLSGEFEVILTDNDDQLIDRDIPLNIEPQTPYYGGPVVAIVNPKSASSAEGVAMAIQNLPQGHVVSFYGTDGSFGMVGGQALLPTGYEINFPFGRSLDKNKIIQLDSKDGIGGVSPDIRIAMTSQRAIRFAAGEDVELEYAVSVLQEM